MKEMLNIYYNITNCSICVRGTKTSIKSNNEEYELIEIYNKERIRNINSLLHQNCTFVHLHYYISIVFKYTSCIYTYFLSLKPNNFFSFFSGTVLFVDSVVVVV